MLETKRHHRAPLDNQDGFTLVEIIAVLVILGILAAVAIPKYFDLQAEAKWPIGPISALTENFYPRNINHMPAGKIFGSLDLDPICLFLDGH
jgi:prepilin-type N-terminal cleavage/methylation domain-containing protein